MQTNPHRDYARRILAQRRIGATTWRKVVQRLTPLPASPERDLLCAVIAQVIDDAEHAEDVPLQVVPSWLQSWYCRYYCRVLGIEHEGLIAIVRDAGAAYAEVADVREAAARRRVKRRRRPAGVA